MMNVNLTIDLDREADGRWIAEALEIPGVMCYGQTRGEAISNAERRSPDWPDYEFTFHDQDEIGPEA